MQSKSDMPTAELQYRLVYSLIVAGKNAAFARRAASALFPPPNDGPNALAYKAPFTVVRGWLEKHDSILYEKVREAKTGNYGKIECALRHLAEADIDLSCCGPEELEEIPGIGPKTSRFFILWTRPDAEYAALDVHILRWLKEQGYDAPKQTPQSSKKYAELERAFLAEAKQRGKKPAELDAEIWEAGSKQNYDLQHKERSS